MSISRLTTGWVVVVLPVTPLVVVLVVVLVVMVVVVVVVEVEEDCEEERVTQHINIVSKTDKCLLCDIKTNLPLLFLFLIMFSSLLRLQARH